MKRLSMMVWVGLFASTLHAEGWEITPTAGVHVGGSVDLTDSTYDKLTLDDGGVYGLAVGYDVSPEGALELAWSHQDTEIVGQKTGQPDVHIKDLNIDQFRFQGLYLMGHDNTRPFVLFGMGVTHFNPGDGSSSESLFNAAIGGGVKLYWGKRLGLRLNALWVPTVLSSDSAFLCQGGGSGGQCTIKSSGQMLSQFEFSSGIIFRL